MMTVSADGVFFMSLLAVAAVLFGLAARFAYVSRKGRQ
jgi:hypothetical protein